MHTGRTATEAIASSDGARQGLLTLTSPASYRRSGSGTTGGDDVLLTLHPGGVFSLEQTHRHGEGVHQVTRVFLGSWSIAPDGTQLWLDNGPGWLRQLTIADDGALRFSASREPESSGRSHRAATATRLLPFHDPFHLSGLVLLGTPSQ